MTLREYLNGKGTEEEREAFIQWYKNKHQIWYEEVKRKKEKKKKMTIKD